MKAPSGPPSGRGFSLVRSPQLSQRHCERSEAIHLSACVACWEMDCFVASLLAMTLKHDSNSNSRPCHLTTDINPPSRDTKCPRLASFGPLRNQRAQGRPDARCTRGLVCNSHKKVRTRAYRSSGEHPAFPAQWFYGLYVVSLVRRALLPPSPVRTALTSLTPAFGRQNHTTSPSASVTLVFVTS